MPSSWRENCASAVMLLWCCFILCGCTGVVFVCAIMALCNLMDNDDVDESSSERPPKIEKEKKDEKIMDAETKPRKTQQNTYKRERNENTGPRTRVEPVVINDPIQRDEPSATNKREESRPGVFDFIKAYFPPPKFLLPEEETQTNNNDRQPPTVQSSVDTSCIVYTQEMQSSLGQESVPYAQTFPESSQAPSAVSYTSGTTNESSVPKPAIVEESSFLGNVFSYFQKANKAVGGLLQKEDDTTIQNEEIVVEERQFEASAPEFNPEVTIEVKEAAKPTANEEVTESGPSVSKHYEAASTGGAVESESSEEEDEEGETEGETEWETETEDEDEDEVPEKPKRKIEIVKNYESESESEGEGETETEGETEYETASEEEEESKDVEKEKNPQPAVETEGEQESFIETTMTKIKDSFWGLFKGNEETNV